ncbi:MAG: long-chain fatty acid--CoA ligase, partial [Bacteroidetes bacterium]|nr:long-chain fatty acid--CoA ligase [Bacteroidota bacterium]
MNQVDNIVQILEQRAKLHPERPAICSKTETISYADFYANVRTTAHFIQEKGLKPGDRILVYIP